MNTLVFSLNAVLPILLLIALGYLLKRFHFMDADFLASANKFVFRIALPTLLFYTIYSIESFEDINWSVIWYALAAVTILFVIGLVLSSIFIHDPKQKGVLIQAVFRSNYAIIGLPLAEAIGGTQAVQVVALVSAFVVPYMNILSVISLTMYIKEEKTTNNLLSTTIQIFKNPLIIAVILGLITLLIRSFIPIDPQTLEPVFTIEDNLPFLYTAIKWVGQIASPFALIVLGGTFEFFTIKRLAKQIVIGTFSRVVLAPLTTLGLAVYLAFHSSYFAFTSADYPALIALLASPTAVASAIMAKEMKNDELLAVQYVVWTTSLSIISIFVVVALFKSNGLL